MIDTGNEKLMLTIDINVVVSRAVNVLSIVHTEYKILCES